MMVDRYRKLNKVRAEIDKIKKKRDKENFSDFNLRRGLSNCQMWNKETREKRLNEIKKKYGVPLEE